MAAPVAWFLRGKKNFPDQQQDRRDQDCTLRNCQKVLGGSRKGHCCDRSGQFSSLAAGVMEIFHQLLTLKNETTAIRASLWRAVNDVRERYAIVHHAYGTPW